jgi:hypothetical protein
MGKKKSSGGGMFAKKSYLFGAVMSGAIFALMMTTLFVITVNIMPVDEMGNLISSTTQVKYSGWEMFVAFFKSGISIDKIKELALNGTILERILQCSMIGGVVLSGAMFILSVISIFVPILPRLFPWRFVYNTLMSLLVLSGIGIAISVVWLMITAGGAKINDFKTLSSAPTLQLYILWGIMLVGPVFARARRS